MNIRENYIKSTTSLLLIAVLIMAASVSMVAYAEEDSPDRVIDIDVDSDSVEAPYPSLLEVTGDGIEEDNEYVLYKDGERTTHTFVADDSDTVTINTNDLDEEPEGQYTLADAPSADISAQDVSDNDESVVIEEASSNVDYVISVHESDGGDPIVEENVGAEEFDAGVEISDYEIETDELSDDELYYVAVSEQGADVESVDDLLASDTLELDVDSHTASNDLNTDVVDRLTYDFIITGDERYELDALDKNQLQTVFVGQELVLGSDDLDDNELYELYYNDSDDNMQLIQDLPVYESNTFNDYELRIDTELTDAAFGPEGEFVVKESDEEVLKWNSVEQNINAEVNKTMVNLYTEHTTADLNITSSNRAGGYDVLIRAEDIDAEEILDAIDMDELNSQSNAFIEDAEDDDVEDVRVTNLDTSGNSNYTVPFEFADAEENAYQFDVEAVDSTAMASADEIDVQFFDDGDASFSQGTFVQQQGDMAHITMSLSDTDVATFSISEGEYEVEFEVEDENGDGQVELLMDTYRAGDYDEYDIDEVFRVADEDSASINFEGEELPAVSGSFDTGLYLMNLHVSGVEKDIGTLFIQDRESHNIDTWVMPHDADMDVGTLEDIGTRQEKVALGDAFVVEVEASGIFSDTLMTNETEPSHIVDHVERENFDTSDEDYLSEFGVHITEADRDRHLENTTLRVEDAEELEIVPEDNKFYLFFDTTVAANPDNDIYDTFDDDFESNPDVEYDITFDFTEDYHYVADEDDEHANLHENVEFVERDVTTQLPSVTVNEETLETRHGLATVENSTVSGHTYIAPHTDNINIVVRTEESEEQDVESEFVSDSVTVSEDNMISASFDLSHLEPDRNMLIEYRPIDGEYREAVTMEAHEPPVIEEFSSDDTPITEGGEVGFNLDVNSTDEDSLQYEWDFDDGTTSQQDSPTHVYDETGTYTVNVTVTDSADQSDSAETDIVVEEAPNEPPTIEEIVAPESLDVDETGTFAVIATDDGPQNELTYTWDFDDGNTGEEISTSHAFSTEGTYDVSVTVTDGEGESTTDDVIVQVTGDSDDEVEDEEYELSINTLDSDTEEIVPGVSIDITQDGEDIVSDSTDGNGVMFVELEDGEYDIQADVSGYNSENAGALIDGEDQELDIYLTSESDGDDEDPSQPGFTLVLAALSMLAASLVAYRRKMN